MPGPRRRHIHLTKEQQSGLRKFTPPSQSDAAFAARIGLENFNQGVDLWTIDVFDPGVGHEPDDPEGEAGVVYL